MKTASRISTAFEPRVLAAPLQHSRRRRPLPAGAWTNALTNARTAVAAGLLALVAGIPAHAQGASAAAVADSEEAFYQRAAICAAALEVDQLALVAQARAGATGLRPELLHITELGFAYVGTAYLKGLRDPRGGEMLKAARSEEKGWDAARHAKVAAECRAEGQKTYDDATSMEQWLVRKKASSRVDKFLATVNPPASGASGAR